jgi:hypothetical protein
MGKWVRISNEDDFGSWECVLGDLMHLRVYECDQQKFMAEIVFPGSTEIMQ